MRLAIRLSPAKALKANDAGGFPEGDD
jgi:hypothetical protein